MANKNYPVTLEWSELSLGRFIPFIRDQYLNLIEAFLDYAIYCAKQMPEQKDDSAYRSMMDAVAYALTDFARYLRQKRTCWMDVDDDFLQNFRDSAFLKTKRSLKSRDDLTVSRTVNSKLRTIYHFFAWAEAVALLTEGKMGWISGDIRSTLAQTIMYGGKHEGQAKTMYPCCYTGVGENSRDSSGQYWATQEDIDNIEAHFHRTQLPATAERNTLLMQIADSMGWRLGSINSLEIRQFSDEAIDKSMRLGLNFHDVTPIKQKAGQLHKYGVPYPVAWEVNRYCRSRHGDDIFKKCHDAAITGHTRVFTSMTSKAPLDNHTISDIFQEAFQAIGAPVGAGLHSFRRKFAEDTVRKEYVRRKDLGQSTAREDVTAAVALKLGHNSKLSQAAYLRVTMQLEPNTKEEEQLNKISEQSFIISELNAKLAAQEVLIRELSVMPIKRAARPRTGKHSRGSAVKKSGRTKSRVSNSASIIH